VGDTSADDILDPKPPAEFLLLRHIPVLIHKEDIRMEYLQTIRKIQNSVPAVDCASSYTSKSLKHVFPLLLRIDGESALQFLDRFVRTDPNDELAVAGSFFKKGNMAAMQEIKVASHKDCFPSSFHRYRF
jgi:hypothetical protein